MKVALLCSGLGRILRGHEIFARGLFDMLADSIDITLYKGGGEPTARERVVANIPRNDPRLDHIQVSASSKWAHAVREQERLRIEHETFAYAALGQLLAEPCDVVHCLEQEVCNIIFDNRHLFAHTPRILFSNGGAIPASDLPRCDFVQEHTDHNLRFSARHKAFMIPHGVDVERFRPGLTTGFRAEHGIPADAFLAISVGTVCHHHKRMDHVIRELATLPKAHLAIVGEENQDTPAIKALGHSLMGDRVVFTKMSNDRLPLAYAAADVFVLGSLFETFGIVYIEAMAMGLPVVCTHHVNQRGIVKEGLFVDMAKPGALAAALRDTPREQLDALGRRSRELALQHYDLRVLKGRYIERYESIAASPARLPQPTLRRRLNANLRNAWRQSKQLLHGRAS